MRVGKPSIKIPIITFHRVGEYMRETVGLQSSSEDCTEKRFRKHLDYLGQNFTVINLEDVVDAVNKKELRDLPERPAVLTFDDGTKDHRETVLPILKEYGFPSTIFIIAGTLAREMPPSFLMQLIIGGGINIDDVKQRILQELELIKPEFAIQLKKGIQVPKERYLGERTDMIRQIRYLINYLLPNRIKTEIIKRLFVHFFGNSKQELLEKMFLNEKDILDLINAEIQIGCHSWSHTALATLEKSDLVKEIVDSRDKIAEVTGCSPQIFSFPFGGKSSYTQEQVMEVARFYPTAVVTGDQRTAFNPIEMSVHEIPRINEMKFSHTN